jgi:hypothetical protein
MMTLMASPRTNRTVTQTIPSRPRHEKNRPAKPAPRPSFWVILMRALAAPHV